MYIYTYTYTYYIHSIPILYPSDLLSADLSQRLRLEVMSLRSSIRRPTLQPWIGPIARRLPGVHPEVDDLEWKNPIQNGGFWGSPKI